jgi:hypothetical protein
MANEVYANMMEVSCKAAAGKSICAFPDVCFTPPQTPATPPGVPIPYPNTGMASDCTSGSSTVKISGQEVMLKNKSYFKKSTGDEAGCAPKKGVVTSKNMGKVYFNAWSMDVKVEGENVVRNLDITTHNHASPPGNSPTWPYIDAANISPDHPCAESVQKEKAACDPNANPPGCQPRMVTNSNGEQVQSGNNCTKECAEARACALPKYKDDKKVCCHPNTTGDHIVEVNCFTQSGGRGGTGLPSEAVLSSIQGLSVTLAAPKTRPRRLAEFEDYNEDQAPTACVGPPIPGSNHNRMQDHRDRIKRQHRFAMNGISHPTSASWLSEQSFWTYNEAANAAVASHQKEFPQCNPECTRAQLDGYHHSVLPGETAEQKNETPVRTYIPKKK